MLQGITSKHKGDSYCLNCFHLYRTKEALEKHMKVCEDKDYCYIEMPKKGESLKYDPVVKSIKAPYIIVADIESLLRKMDTCANDPRKSSTEKKNKHEMCGYSLFNDCSFDAAHKICNLMYNTPREIPVAFHNGSSYDYHFIMKGLAEEFEGNFECLGENKEKYITFSVPIKIESNNDQTIIYRIKFIDSFRFMSTSLSTLVDNLSNRIDDKRKCDSCGYNLEYISRKKSGKLSFKCFNFKRKFFEEFDEDLIKKFKITYRFCNGDIDKFMLLLRKGVYPYEYMDDWDRINEEKLTNKSDFYSSLNMEDISEIDYRHAKKVFNKFYIKNLGENHDLYLQSDTLLLADVFESFRNLCIKTYKLDPTYFLSLPGLAWQACLKRTGVKLELASDIHMLLMIEKGIKEGICHSVLRHAKANNKYMKDYDENKDDSSLIYTDYNNLYGKAKNCQLMVLNG